MIAQIIYWIGVILTVWCIYDMFTAKSGTSVVWKAVFAVLILCTSWVGLAFYWLFLRDRLK